MRIVLVIFCLFIMIVELYILYDTKKRKEEYEKEEYTRKIVLSSATIIISFGLSLLMFKK